MVHRSPFITILEEAADAHPQNIAFKVPILGAERVIQGWKDISYIQAYEKVNTVARYWLKTLKLPPGSVVGLWMPGLTISDMLHIFGIMRADYVPHVLNSGITNAEVAASFFQETNCGVIIYAPQALASLKELPEYFICHPIRDAEEILEENSDDILLDSSKSVFDNEEVVMIFHTSGSTSGRPKLVRLRRKWFEANSRKRIVQNQKFIVPRVGSFCHVSQFISFLVYYMETTCLVIVPWTDYSAEDVIQMYKECGLTIFIQYSPLLSTTIRRANQNPELLSILQAFPAVFFTGAALNKVDMEWCKNNNITLRVRLRLFLFPTILTFRRQTAFSTTETGGLMVCGEDPSIFRLIKVDGCSYGMVPVGGDSDTTSQPPLLELVVFSNSLDCPDRSLCDPVDGNFHTKDLFEEIKSGEYIEDRVYSLCGDLISICLVVGSEKRSPALLVEPTSIDINEMELIQQLNVRLTSINEGGYPHERITPGHILVVPPGEIPRTSFKRNVIRVATEIKFRSQIDALFA